MPSILTVFCIAFATFVILGIAIIITTLEKIDKRLHYMGMYVDDAIRAGRKFMRDIKDGMK